MYNSKGLTFLETIVALALFAVVMLGAFQIFNTALNSNYRATQEIIATNLARGLMAEIMSKNFEDPDEDPGSFGREEGADAPRYDFDDVDDFNNWSESPPITIGRPDQGRSLPMDGSTIATPNYSDFTRSVDVEYCLPDDTTGEIEPQGTTYQDYKLITVTVSGSYAKGITIDEVKAKEEE